MYHKHRNQNSNQRFSKNKSPRPDGLAGEFYQRFREELKPILLKILQKIKEGGKLPNLFYKATITLIPKPNKTATIKKISLVKVDAKTLNKIIAKRIQKHIIRIIHHDQVGCIPCMQGFFNICKSINVIHHINNLKDKIHVIISTDNRESFPQNSTPIYDKNSPESRHKRNICVRAYLLQSWPTLL